ncbi:BnaC06g01870D [Brassica napus]|uniref:BnaC06g01870D protein n=1 Tax=Brassica napus TaxID=3708 RepID=A0A078I0B5_BRANA|nr:BnaC06g01870D [Brassica napus]
MKFSQLTGMKKEIVQNLEWLEAQKIEISIDLIAESKKHLQFLGVVDCNQLLYDGHALKRAIYRYNAYWLPLLAKHSESTSICEGPLVPPFDCEWVWHCHRLNPVRYKSDCEEFYGRVLDNSGILSSANGSCKLQTEKLWKRLYPMESYDLDLDKAISEPISPLEKCTTYDLVSAAKRQSSFYLEVSRANVDSEIIMEQAVGRYKAFLYLIKQNREKTIKLISVPTYDIDLIWHTHQLNPSSYYKDMVKIFGNILQHDDTADSDSSEGMNLDTVFSGTTAQWEETFGQRYWKESMDTTPHTPVVVETEKSGAAARCFAEAAEKAEKNSARCFSVEAEKKNATCFAVEAEKNSARCFAVEAEKKNASCFAVEAKKNSDKCFAVEAEKKNAIALQWKLRRTAEKKKARCFAVEAGKNNARCFAVEAEKKNARCFAVEAGKNNARCFAVEAEKKNARCFAITNCKRSARCFAIEAEKKNAMCFAMIDGKSSARCFAMATGKNSARCFAVAAEKNGGCGCGNLMENNAKENAPLAEGATAA